MARHTKQKRTKAYRPRHIQIPVMPELQREFMFATHGALAALRLAPNMEAFDQLAATFNVITIALSAKRAGSVILDSGVRALQDVQRRFERTGHVSIARHELGPIENAVIVCETLVKELDILGLHSASQAIKVSQMTTL